MHVVSSDNTGWGRNEVVQIRKPNTWTCSGRVHGARFAAPSGAFRVAAHPTALTG